MSNDFLKDIPLIGTKSVTQQVTEILSGLIVDGTISEGDFLPTEEELCRSFNIGRSSVREAIKTLESRGLVKKQHGKGVMVVDESIKATSEMLQLMLTTKKSSLKDLLEFRNTMEIKVAELAAERAEETDLEKIGMYLRSMKSSEFSITQFVEADFGFHKALAEASKNDVYVLMVETIRPMLYDLIKHTLHKEFNPELVFHYHEKIYEAIKAGDSQAASQTMQQHLVGTLSQIEE